MVLKVFGYLACSTMLKIEAILKLLLQSQTWNRTSGTSQAHSAHSPSGNQIHTALKQIS